MKDYAVKFQYIMQQVNGVPYPALIGLGSDGTLWVDPDEFGVEPEELQKMIQSPGTCPMVLLDHEARRVFVSARAVAETIAAADMRAKMIEGIEVIVREMQRTRQKNDTLRNN